MEYFFNIEKNDYELWQAELLIESFKYNNCSDKLLFVISENSKDIFYPVPLKNVFEHQKTLLVQNIGEKRGFKPLNALHNLFLTQKSKFLKQPFVWLTSDMVLRKEIQYQSKDVPEIVFSPFAELTFDVAVDNVGSFWEVSKNDKEYYQKNWIPFGSLAIFNSMPLEIFYRAVVIAESLATKQLVEKKEIWKHTDKLAWAINLSDHVGKILLTGDYGLTDAMYNNSDSPIIHYEHGMPPTFNKTQYMFKPPAFLSYGNPFDVISDNPATANAHFMSNLAKNIKSRNNNA